MTVYSYSVATTENSLSFYRIGYELGGDMDFTQDSLIAVTGESLGTGNGNAIVFTTANVPLRLGSVHVYIDAVETSSSNYSVNLNDGTIVFVTPPAMGEAITVDYNYPGLVTFSIDATLPMTITDTGIGRFNDLMRDFSIIQAVNEYWTVDSTTTVSTDGIFDFVITVDDI